MPSYNHELVTHIPSTETIMSPSGGPHEFLLESLGHFLSLSSVSLGRKGRERNQAPGPQHICIALVWPWEQGGLSQRDNSFINIVPFFYFQHFFLL